jgi:glycosyltransferase involved in cell wall biosynthesis
MTKPYDLKVIIPVYNEEGAIKNVIKDWSSELSKLNINFQLITYNDGSKDSTLSFLKSLQKEFLVLKVIDKKNSGHGPTILKGYKENLDAEWLFQVDSDNELKAKEFSDFWKAREGYDFLIGIRQHRDSPFVRVVTTQISRFVVGLFYGTKVTDVNAPYRLMRVAAFKEELVKIPNNTFAPNLIISGLASVQKMCVKQFNVVHHSRQTGEVSIKKWGLLKAAFTSFLQTIIYRFTI